jgi:predicted esterase
VADGVSVVGAVLLEAGGAFQFRGAQGDCYPTAEELTARGYQCFVVDYRLTRDLGAIDLARATRFVRAHWKDYGLPHEDAIAVMGYSAGGIAAGQMLLDWDGTTPPALYDTSYPPDELDAVIRWHVRRVFDKYGQNLSRAAQALKVARNTAKKYL